METPDIPAALATLDPVATEGRLQLDEASYFLSKIELQPRDEPTMAPWRKRLFIATSYITADAVEHFGLPARSYDHHRLPHRGVGPSDVDAARGGAAGSGSDVRVKKSLKNDRCA